MKTSLAARLSGLYGIADLQFRPEIPLAVKLSTFLDGGAVAVQVRCKGSTSSQMESARETVAACRGRALAIVNDRVDVALVCGADGVHLGSEDLPITEARKLARDRLIIGATVRTLAEARAAADAGADYVGFGPMYATTTKNVGMPLRTLAMLKEVAVDGALPVVAIGGVTLERAAELFTAGAAAVAVVSDILGHPDPVARARAFAAVAPRLTPG